MPDSTRLHVLDQLPAGQPVLAVPVDRGRLAPRAVGLAHRRDRLARPSPCGLKFVIRRTPAPYVQTSRCQRVAHIAGIVALVPEDSPVQPFSY